MVQVFKTLTILILAALIFGGAAYFGYELYLKPRNLDREEKKNTVVTEPTPIPDYSIPVYEAAVKLAKDGHKDDARKALTDFLQKYPESTKLADARRSLGEINSDATFSSSEPAGKIAYTVAKGDSLVKIASKHKTNAELIFRTNNLETINLQIGQQLFIPQMDPKIVVDRTAHTVTLFNNGAFYKEYPALSIKAGGGTAAVQTKVSDKLALVGANRVAFGDKNYASSDRWLMLAVPGAVIRGAPPAPETGTAPPLPPGIVVSQPDIEEIFVLVSRNTPVTIQ